MTDKYHCDNHKLDLVCRGCVKAWITRHDAMKTFLEDIYFNPSEHKNTHHLSSDVGLLLKELGLIKNE